MYIHGQFWAGIQRSGPRELPYDIHGNGFAQTGEFYRGDGVVLVHIQCVLKVHLKAYNFDEMLVSSTYPTKELQHAPGASSPRPSTVSEPHFIP